MITCKKIAFKTKREAMTKVSGANRVSKKYNLCEQQYAYKCEFCKKWHTTRMSRKEYKSKTNKYIMKSKELRLGNYWTNGVEECKIDISTLTDIVNAEGENTDRFWEPVPLSIKWLKKFGFKEVMPKKGIAKAFVRNGVRIEMSNSGNFYHKGKIKPYVHKLQNLYFELRDEELIEKQ